VPRKFRARIERFAQHFREQIEKIRGLRSGDGNGQRSCIDLAMHQKILYLTVVDSLARVRYPDISQNAQRFHKFLAESGAWSEGALVSVPVLEARLHPRALDRRLTRHVLNLLRKHSPLAPNGYPFTEIDVEMSVLQARTSTPEGQALIRQSQHFKLLYSYRNFVVHEFREPGYAMEVFGESRTDPWYHSYINELKWHLLYPVGFFDRLAMSCVSSMRTYLTEESIDPYARVYDTTTWSSNIRRGA
jgi:hypothetical protein